MRKILACLLAATALAGTVGCTVIDPARRATMPTSRALPGSVMEQNTKFPKPISCSFQPRLPAAATTTTPESTVLSHATQIGVEPQP